MIGSAVLDEARPLIFTGPSVPAIARDLKTQTRRIAWEGMGDLRRPCTVRPEVSQCPHGLPGERIRVRETWRTERHALEDGIRFAADDAFIALPDDERIAALWREAHAKRSRVNEYAWRSPIFLPRWASRLTLEITEMRVQRLQEISEADAIAEGAPDFFERYEHISRDQRICTGELARDFPHRACFACVWDELNGDRALWSTNPWVYALTFRRITT
jgi:hypothetical protein